MIEIKSGEIKELNVSMIPLSSKIELVDAAWDKDFYYINDMAILTAQFHNPTSQDFTFIAYLRWTNPYTGETEGVQDTMVIGAGQTVPLPLAFTVTEKVGKVIHIDLTEDNEVIRTFRMPDLIVSTPTGEANIIVEGGRNIPHEWPANTPYTMSRKLVNIGDAEGTSSVRGSWYVHPNSNNRRIINMGDITLAPGESKTVSFTISWEEMLSMQDETVLYYYYHYGENLRPVIASVTCPAGWYSAVDHDGTDILYPR